MTTEKAKGCRCPLECVSAESEFFGGDASANADLAQSARNDAVG